MSITVKRCVVALVISVLAVGCQENIEADKHEAEPITFEEELALADVYPMANGTAYLYSFGRIYFVNGNIAEKVSGLPSSSFGNLTGLSDGSALYLSGFSDPGLFKLRGATATAVVEGDSSDNKIGDVRPYGFFFAESQRLKREIREFADMSDAEREDMFSY